jgi:chemotaxis protein methyltransferase CheR
MSYTDSNARTQEALLVPGEFVFTKEDFRRITAMLHEDAGIYISDAKASLVYSRLTKRLRALGLESFRDYCALVSRREGIDERQKMLAALTTNVTRFFREPHHFEHLKRNVLPRCADVVTRGGRLRIWSAACSDGQEPYSIAMTILSVIPNAPKLDVRVLATDIDPNMVAAGNSGIYNEDAISAVPPDLRSRWFVPVDDGKTKNWAVNDELASLVSFRELNLVGVWPMKRKFDAIFCRNVVIYFEERTQNALWSRFVPTLVPNGRLYIGHSERVSGPAAECFQGEGVTTYRLRESARA